MEKRFKGNTVRVAFIGGTITLLILLIGTIWMGQSATRDTSEAVHSVSLLYLDELAGRREQVVEKNLQDNIQVIRIAVSSLTEDDLHDLEHLEDFQRRMKALFHLEKFAFVDDGGLIYTSTGTQTNLDSYSLDPEILTEPSISVINLGSEDMRAIIAVPIEPVAFQGKNLLVCFMEITMEKLLEGAAITTNHSESTFCNIYTMNGISLSNKVLSGQANVKNLFEALGEAEFDEGYSLDHVKSDFASGTKGVITFTYHGIQETLTYFPIDGTDWMLTYLIRESVISDRINSVTRGTIIRSIIQSLLTMAVLVTMLFIIIRQTKRSALLKLEKKTLEAENRIKQEEMEHRMALQEDLQEALAAAEQANKAKTAFLSNMSHEIRTPMNAIIGLQSIVLHDPTISEHTRDHLEKIGASANHLLGIINDILDMSRIESGRMIIKKEEFSFPKMLEQVNTMISGQCRDKNIRYECRLQGRIDDHYIGDDMKLRQVLLNILGNAVKFTPEGGEVTLLVEDANRFDDKTTLRFTMKDTGIGMSKEYLPHLFDPFSQEDSSATNRYGSTGLGMPITKSIVELMNGQIEVESEKGVGTTFHVTVTLTESEHASGTEDAGELPPHEMHVLAVDDDPVACEHAQIVLGQVGMTCETALSGAEALEKVRISHARGEDFDLILVDWKMPELDGVETTRRIREIVGHDTPIIILTSYNWDDIADAARQAGVDTFVAKPLFAGTVLDEFREAFRKKREKTEEHRAELTGRRILLAEDMEVNAEIMVMVLSMREMEADVAENGRIAVEKFAASPEGYYDAILMDMRMPEMDGLEATRVIRAMDREDAAAIPIIALTANAFDEDVQRSLQAGLNAHLSKPVEPDVLFHTLETLIRD